MTERDRRQRRLLAVRELQAELAASHLRALRSRQDELRQDLARWRGLMQVDAHTTTPVHQQWLLACAEQEIAALRAGEVVAAIDQATEAIAAQALEERERRIAREQMQRLCDRAGNMARALSERTEQARLDDMFSAARLRRLPGAGEQTRGE